MSADPTPADLLACASAAAIAAGHHALAHAARRDRLIARFKHDVKLELDLECQDVAESVIRARFPAHAILGEEKTAKARPPTATGEYTWIIDPIDGTVNFSHGLPLWCCSVACRRRNDAVAGAVFAPELNQLFLASADAPSTLNGKPIHVSSVSGVENAVILTGMDKHAGTNRQALSILSKIALNTQKARILGSAALDLCWVAAGRADGYFEKGIYEWDVAAGGLIVRQAGGNAEPTLPADTEHRLAFLASNGRIHNALRALVGRLRPSSS